jgi:predicted transposase YdaD
LHEHEATGILETLLRYLVAADSDLNLRTVQRALASAPATRNRIMSIAEQMMQKGRQEGIQKGRQEGRQEGTLMGQIQLMQELLGLPVTALTHLSSRPASELRKLATELRARLRKQRV